MPEVRYSYEDCPTIERFSNDDSFMRGLMGPFGSGKSSGCVIEILRRAQAQEPGPDGVRRSRWAVIRNTYQQLRDTTIRTFFDWAPPHHVASEGNWLKSEFRLIIDKIPGVECEILFRALDRPDQVSNLLSLELTGAWVNEAREVPYSIIEALQGRVGRYPSMKDGGCSWYGVICDTNPPDEDSWWYELFEVKRPSNAQVFKQPSGISDKAENRSNLIPNYYENLAEGKDEEYKRVYIQGKYGFVIDGKPIYPEYNDEIHCKEVEPILGVPIRRGWDFGLTPACTFSQMLPSGQWIIFDELIGTDVCEDGVGFDRFSDVVIQHSNKMYPNHDFEDFADPAGGQRSQTDEKTCYQIARAKDIFMSPGEVSDTARIESVKKPLNSMVDGKPGLLVHPRCKILRKGFMGGYQYRRMQTSKEQYADKPEKNQYSHPHDALQYDASRLFISKMRKRRHEPLKKDTRWIV